MQQNGKANMKAPGIFPVLGAFFLDAGLLGFFWFLGMVLATAVWVLAQFFLQGGKIANPDPGPIGLLLISLPSLYLAVLVLSRLRGEDLPSPVTLRTSKGLVLLGISVGAGTFLFTLSGTYLSSAIGLPVQAANQVALEGFGRQWPLMLGVFAIAIAPVFEELLFRRQIFARFANAGYSGTGYLLSSLLFALMHEPVPAHGLAAWSATLLLYASMGALFARLYQSCGKLWPAVLAHAFNNLLAIAVLLLA